MHQVLDLKCPGCGEPSPPSAKQCRYCGRPVVISTFRSIRDLTPPEAHKYASAYGTYLETSPNSEIEMALGICMLKLGLHQKALERLSKAIAGDVDNPDAYFYAAVTLLGGKRPFLVPMAQVREALVHLDAARMLEERGIFDYMSSLIRRDFFERKHLRISPTADDELVRAYENNVTQADIALLHEFIRVPVVT